MKYPDRPLWYDVVKAKPPLPTPSPKHVPTILYPEDYIRVNFQQRYIEPGAVNLTNERTPSISQTFVKTYLALRAEGNVPAEELFERTAELMKTRDAILVTHQEHEADAMTYRTRKRMQKERELEDMQDEVHLKQLYKAKREKAKPDSEAMQPDPYGEDMDSLYKDMINESGGDIGRYGHKDFEENKEKPGMKLRIEGLMHGGSPYDTSTSTPPVEPSQNVSPSIKKPVKKRGTVVDLERLFKPKS